MTKETRFWDNIAEKYAAQPLPNPEATARKLAITKERLHDGDLLLDIGCGTGTIALELAPHASHVHALDISPAMIAIANRKKAASASNNVTFYAATLEDELPFEPESFGVICAYNILHLVPDMQRTLEQIHALLKPGGTFISSTACLRESYVPYRPIIAVMKLLGKAPSTVSFLSIEGLMADIETAGFGQLSRPNVGAKATTAFVVATKPLRQPVAA